MSELKLSNNATANDRREAFCIEYAKDRNATKAAIRAGYSPKSAAVSGFRLLKDDKVKARLAELMARDNERRLANGDQLKEMLEDAATLDLAFLVEMGMSGVTLKEFHEIDPRLRRLITEISNVSGKTGWKINFKVFSKEKAVDLLAKIYGIDKGNPIQVNIMNITSLVNKYS